MKRYQRVTKNYDFQRILKRKNISTKYLILYFVPNKKNLRVGISVPKKFVGAVGRNKQRRHVREILNKQDIWNKKFDTVVILRKPFLELTFNKKSEELKIIFERI